MFTPKQFSSDSPILLFQHKNIEDRMIATSNIWNSKSSILLIIYVLSLALLYLIVQDNKLYLCWTVMDTHRRRMTLFLLCMIIPHTAMADPSVTCFQDSQKCEVSSDNLLEVFVETTWEECSQLCRDELKCQAFNFFGPESDFHQHNSCLMLSSCPRKLPCKDCVIGVSQDDWIECVLFSTSTCSHTFWKVYTSLEVF